MSGLAVGDAIEPLVVESVDGGRMKTVAALLRDPNPIHWDPDAVRALGLGERPINQGPITMSYLLEAVVRAAGGAAKVSAFSVRFLGNVYEGERVECGGTVVAIDADTGAVQLELEASADGRPVLAGAAEIRR